MSAPPLSIREGTDSDIPAVLGLMRRSLGEGNIPRTPEFWAWKHQQNPFGPSPFLLAEAEGQLVGVRVFMRWQWRKGARAFRAVRAVDTATHPDFQGRGIFKKLTLGLVGQVQQEGISFVFNTPNEKSRPGYLKMGWSSLGRVSLWIRPVGLGGVRRIAERLVAGARAGAQAEGEEVAADRPMATEGAPGQDDGDGDGVDPAAFAPFSPSRLHIPKDAQYLRWRYTACPAFRYRFHTTRRAVVVSRVRSRFGLRELTLCEVLFERSREGLADAEQTIREALAASDADYSICSLPPDALTLRVLAGARFLPAPKAGPILTVRPLAPGVEDVILGKRGWAPSIGDLELF